MFGEELHLGRFARAINPLNDDVVTLVLSHSYNLLFLLQNTPIPYISIFRKTDSDGILPFVI